MKHLWIWLSIAVAIGFLVTRKKGNKKNQAEEATPCNHHEINEPISDDSNKYDKKTSAQQYILEHVDMFAPLLHGLNEGKLDCHAWQILIEKAQNYQLLQYWRKANGKVSSWLTLLQMWGISYDTCQSFLAVDAFKPMYHTETDTEIETGIKYEVITPCWIITKNLDDGSAVKKIIVKGVVKIAE